jgi:hypothetical protein
MTILFLVVMMVMVVMMLASVGSVSAYCPIGEEINKGNVNRSDNSDNSTYSCTIFLDHGREFCHAEVFYPVAVLMATRHWPDFDLTFVVQRKFAVVIGLYDFWLSHASEGVLGTSILLYYHIYYHIMCYILGWV